MARMKERPSAWNCLAQIFPRLSPTHHFSLSPQTSPWTSSLTILYDALSHSGPLQSFLHSNYNHLKLAHMCFCFHEQEQCFSNFNVHTNHVGILLKYSLEWCLRVYAFNKLQGDTDTVGPQTTHPEQQGSKEGWLNECKGIFQSIAPMLAMQKTNTFE